jgi:hypothetical protein
MRTLAVLIECACYDSVTASTKTVRFCNRNDPRVTTFNGNEWRPILTKAPTVGLSVFNGDFTGFGETTIDSFVISGTEKDLDPMAAYTWYGAVIKVYAGDVATGTFPLIFTATGDGLTRKANETLTVGLATQDRLLEERQMLYLAYAGTGDIEGTTDLVGVVKPMVFGNSKNCKPVLIDPVRQIYQVHGYGPVNSIDACYEGGLAIGTGGVAAATQSGTYATFRDTAVAQGEWIKHPNLGLVKLGSQPSFPITLDVKGDSNGVSGGAMLTKAADVVKRMVTMNVAGVTLSASSITSLNAAAPYPIDLYYDEQIMIKDAMAMALKSIGAYWFWDATGVICFGRMRFGASEFTLSSRADQLPDVLSINQLPVAAPAWSLRLGANACHFVHDQSSVPQALVDFQDQLDAFDASINTIFPPSATPPAGAIAGDLWPDTSTGVTTLRRYDGAVWIVASSTGAFTYAPSSTAPTSPTPQTGYLWPDISTGTTILKRWSGSAWVVVSSTGNFVYPPSTTAPTVPTPQTGDLWPDTSTGTTILKRWSGSAWVLASATGNIVYPPGTTAPTVPTPQVGDLWPDTSTGVTVLKRWDGAAWVIATTTNTGLRLKNIGSVAAGDLGVNSFKRTAAGSDYNYAVVGDVPLASSAFVRVGASSSGSTVIGLDDDTTTTALASQKWLLNVVVATGAWTLYKDGTSVATGTAGAVAAGSNVELRYWGTKIEAVIGTTSVVNYATGVSGGVAYFPKWWAFQISTVTQMAAGFTSNLDYAIIGGTTKPEDNADVTKWIDDPVQSLNFSYSYDGTTPDSGQYDRTIAFKLNNAVGQVTAGITWTYTVKTGTINGKTNADGAQAMTNSSGTGQLAVTSASGGLATNTASVEVKATIGTAFWIKTVLFTRSYAGQPAGGGGGGGGGPTTLVNKTSGFDDITTGSFVDLTGTMTGTTPAGVTSVNINVNLDASPYSGTTGFNTIEMKAQRLISAVWTDIGAVRSDGSQYSNGVGGDPPGPVDDALIVFTQADTGLTASTSYSWRVVGRISAGGLRAHSVGGTVGVTA